MFNKKLKEEIEVLKDMVNSHTVEIENIKKQLLYEFVIDEKAPRSWYDPYGNWLAGRDPYGKFEGKNIYVDEVLRLILDKMKLEIEFKPKVEEPRTFKLVKK